MKKRDKEILRDLILNKKLLYTNYRTDTISWFKVSETPIPTLKDRPKCLCCGRSIKIKKVYRFWNPETTKYERLSSPVWTYNPYGPFCKKVCSQIYGVKEGLKKLDIKLLNF